MFIRYHTYFQCKALKATDKTRIDVVKVISLNLDWQLRSGSLDNMVYIREILSAPLHVS